jgi:hypothetical protein
MIARMWFWTVSAMSVGALVLGCVPAFAAGVHGFTGSFGGEGSGDGQFKGPAGVAVGQLNKEDVYVVDEGNNRVEYFSSTGVYEGRFSGSDNPNFPEGFSSPRAVAVDNSAGPSKEDVYVLDGGHGVIDKFSPTGVYICELTGTGKGCQVNGEPPTFGGLEGLAVDAAGNLWVYENNGGNGRVDEFNGAGIAEKQFTTERGTKPGFTIDSNDTVYLLFGLETVGKYTSAGEPLGESEFKSTALAIGLSTNDLYVGQETSVAEYGPGGEPFGESIQTEIGLKSKRLAGSSGIAVNSATEVVYVADSVRNEVDIFGFGLPPSAPSTEEAKEVTGTSAMLEGKLSAGSEQVAYYFEYSLGSSCTGEHKTAGREAAAGSKVSTAVTAGIEPKKEYTFCLVAETEFGSASSSPLTFTTKAEAPTIESESVSSIGQTEATVGAQINPNTELTHYYFQYSTEPTLTGAIDAPQLPGNELPGGFGGFPASPQLLTSLTPNTIYYYRVVAENGTPPASNGSIQEFLTLPATPTSTATKVTQTSATITGTFSPGGQDTHYYLEYGPCETTCPTSPYFLKTTEEDAGAGTSIIEPAIELPGLTVGTTYHYRLVVSNASRPSFGGLSYSPEREIQTLPLAPQIAIQPPAITGAVSATLVGRILLPHGASAATYYFRYAREGTSLTEGSTTPADELTWNSTQPSNGQLVTASITGLQPGATYHYQLLAKDTGGADEGEEQTFRTGQEPNEPPLPPGFSLAAAPFTTPPRHPFPDITSLIPISSKAHATKPKKRKKKTKARSKKGYVKAKRRGKRA